MGLAVISAISILVHSSALSIIANCFSLLLLSAFSFNKSNSSLMGFAFSCYSVVSSFIYMIIDTAARLRAKKGEQKSNYRGFKFLVGLGVAIFSFLFFVMYQKSNPLFAENTKWINLDFISFEWVMFTFSGFLLVYGLFYHNTIEPISRWESSLPSINTTADDSRAPQFQIERSAGLLLFALVNFMLIILNVGDIYTIWFKGTLPKGISHSDFVHNGVELIILSIVIATLLIMALYRNDFRTIKNSKLLRALVYVWIIQNLVMLFSTACRNQMYIEKFNLTDMRIGVYVWIGLALIGLILVFFKIAREKSNWFLIRSNASVWFTALAISSLLNWDLIITRYNLENKPLTEVDFKYLFSLSASNIPELLDITKRNDFSLIEENIKSHQIDNGGQSSITYKKLIMRKIKRYLEDYNSDWQSWDFRDKRIMGSLIKNR
jgi:hypothetical protein